MSFTVCIFLHIGGKVMKIKKKSLMLSLAALAVTVAGVAASLGNTVDKSEKANVAMEREVVLETAVLKQGSSGQEVREVQRRLKLWGYYNGSVDGVFGVGTRNAVISFQRKNGLKADGVVGKSTYKALGMTKSYEILVNADANGGLGSGSNTTGGLNGFSSSEVYLLAKTIYAEGRGEPYIGQVAIGAVVLNRIRSKDFPNTVSGVVYQKHAFTAVSDGQINLTPNDTAMKAARDAINGWDPTGGALYYYNPAVATSSWIFDRQTVTVIGKHVFAI
jgi:N-acetylmuramoyl-L-alanine amidase